MLVEYPVRPDSAGAEHFLAPRFQVSPLDAGRFISFRAYHHFERWHPPLNNSMQATASIAPATNAISVFIFGLVLLVQALPAVPDVGVMPNKDALRFLG